MAKSAFAPREALYPVPVVLVSCLDRAHNRANAITIAWCGTVSSVPPRLSVSIRPSRYSHGLITAERSFVVNIPSAALLKKADLCGVVSGRDTDKLASCSFTAVASTKVSAPMIKECPVNIECALKEVVRLDSHDMFIGDIVAVHADDTIIDSRGRIDYGKADPVVFNCGEYWDLGKRIGHYGFSQA